MSHHRSTDGGYLLDQDRVLTLQEMASIHNPYVHIYRTAMERWAAGDNIGALRIKMADTSHLDYRYNRPTASEIAVMLPGTGEEVTYGKRDIVVQLQNGPFRRVSELNSNYCALRYPMLFTSGEPGWHEHMLHINSVYVSILCSSRIFSGRERRITQREYYAYRVHISVNESGVLHRAGCLFQEYIVDAYAQIEYSRLLWFCLNQKQIRVDSYSAIQNAAENGDDLNNVGQRVVLPSSFIRGPRQMYQLYHDAMAIVRTCGKPDLFITMTCNPRWPELTEALLPGQDAQDRPDLVARVFKLKLNEMLEDLYKSYVFSDVVGHVHVVEFQKRGLPHAHILLILDRNHKPHTTDVVDQMVSAEIPDQTLFPDLYKTVVSFMLHGPCGPTNPNSSCMQDGRCTKWYPRQYTEKTSFDKEGFPLYQRSSTGFTVVRGRHEFCNCDVVPFNRYLSAKFNCHINVEVATAVTAVKYLFKYVYKGHNRAAYQMVDDDDNDQQRARNEIDDFVDARYISAPPESVYRILSFPMHDHKPSVERLALHEKDNHFVTYDPLEETSEDVLSREGIKDTSLTAFFNVCTKYPDLTENLLYPDVPSKFVLKITNGKKEWRLCRRGTSVGRVCFCPPSAGERYYIRMLLYHSRSYLL
jgi:hypothetical protein